MISVVSPWAISPPKSMKTARVVSPRRDRRMFAQDKRSAVLGYKSRISSSPVGAPEMAVEILKGLGNVFDRATRC